MVFPNKVRCCYVSSPQRLTDVSITKKQIKKLAIINIIKQLSLAWCRVNVNK